MIEKLITVAFCLLFPLFTFAQTDELNIIPKPQTVKNSEGSFTFDEKTKIIATDDAGRRIAAILNNLLFENYGFKLLVTGKPQKGNAIVFITAVPTTGVTASATGASAPAVVDTTGATALVTGVSIWATVPTTGATVSVTGASVFVAADTTGVTAPVTGASVWATVPTAGATVPVTGASV